MATVSFRSHFSRNTLALMMLTSTIVVALIFWQKDLLYSVYFSDQVTTMKIAFNTAILTLFGIGLVRMILILLSYMREEAAVRRFLRNLYEEGAQEPMLRVSKNSIIGRRYLTMEHLYASTTPISQGAMAASLLANESTRTSLPKFVGNVLILCGVLGTVVSLSMALMGASDLLQDVVSFDGMKMVIHGMSTALSTTMTAIVCYLFFGYFILKLGDAQTNLISAVEQITTVYLMPRFQVDKESTLYEFTALVRSMQVLVKQMQASQQLVTDTEARIEHMLDGLKDSQMQSTSKMDQVSELLRRGFRLQDAP